MTDFSLDDEFTALQARQKARRRPLSRPAHYNKAEPGDAVFDSLPHGEQLKRIGLKLACVRSRIQRLRAALSAAESELPILGAVRRKIVHHANKLGLDVGLDGEEHLMPSGELHQ